MGYKVRECQARKLTQWIKAVVLKSHNMRSVTVTLHLCQGMPVLTRVHAPARTHTHTRARANK